MPAPLPLQVGGGGNATWIYDIPALRSSASHTLTLFREQAQASLSPSPPPVSRAAHDAPERSTTAKNSSSTLGPVATLAGDKSSFKRRRRLQVGHVFSEAHKPVPLLVSPLPSNLQSISHPNIQHVG